MSDPTGTTRVLDRVLLPLLGAATLLGANSLQAGGFALIEQGSSGMGNAYAGASAVSADASTVWFNPAGMLELEGAELALAGHVIAVKSDFSNRGTTLNSAFGLGEVEGRDRIDSGGNSFVPNAYYVRPFSKNLVYGFGISVPFGNATDYSDDWVGRYQAVESSVQVIDINPSVAYRINDQFSIGGGISLQSMDATLASAVDSSATCLGLVSLGSVDLAQCAGAGLTTPGTLATDGFAEVQGDSIDFTFNLGLLYKPTTATKLGVAYRHSIDHTLEGDASYTTNAALSGVLAANAIPLFVDGGVEAIANLPASLMFSGAHQLNDKLQLLADATWTQWSSLQELRVVSDNPVQPDTFNTLGYEDVWRVSAGVNFQQTPKLTWRAGLAYDQDPVPSTQLRTPRIPGSDRTWVAFGIGYQHSKSISIDFGYAHLFVDETPIANASEAAGGTTIRGVYDVTVDLVSAQFNWKFN